MSEQQGPETTNTEHGKTGAEPDVVSDPARSTQNESSEWTSEGGAASTGPATDTDNND